MYLIHLQISKSMITLIMDISKEFKINDKIDWKSRIFESLEIHKINQFSI